MPTKRIILFPQDKGGIGKSVVATIGVLTSRPP